LNVNCKGGAKADWAAYFVQNPGSQRTGLDALLRTSQAIDAKYGTSITQQVISNISNGLYRVFP
jgi:hypothetical protein